MKQKPFFVKKQDVIGIIALYKEELLNHTDVKSYGFNSKVCWEAGWGFSTQEELDDRIDLIFGDTEHVLHSEFVKHINHLMVDVELDNYTVRLTKSSKPDWYKTYILNPYDRYTKFTENLFINRLLSDIKDKRFTQ